MKLTLFPFQYRALNNLRMNAAIALSNYHQTHSPQVVSFTAPTGAGKTIIMASLIETIFFGDERYPDQPNAVFLWLSDSPQLNEQSKLKIDAKADRIRIGQTVTVTEDSFDQEMFDDGHIYFLNTQKLSKSSNLTRGGDRNYTIWETIANTALQKADRFYVIIDEAHRGMQGREAGKATTIMQKFLKGSPADHLPVMPIVIGMSATSERFNKLVEGTTSTIHKSIVTADEVRASGLLKDRIIIAYPEENTVNKDMAVLQAAVDDWKEKWDHWEQYCREQHYAYVNPVLVIQVQNGSGSNISDTDLNDCLHKIEERSGFRFDPGQVVHTFGQTNSDIQINGLSVRYEEPSRIAEDRNIRVVFFKENLSTGWDCPRAETMMSFRHASDATYIAQLLGRMVRTPMQMHIQVDEVLNDVHLYLPYFDETTVSTVVTALQSAEGGEIPTDIFGEAIGEKHYDTLTVRGKSHSKKPPTQVPGQVSMGYTDEPATVPVSPAPIFQDNDPVIASNPQDQSQPPVPTLPVPPVAVQHNQTETASPVSEPAPEQPTPAVVLPAEPDLPVQTEPEEPNQTEDLFDREAVMKFINDAGLLTYDVRTVRIHNYLTSLFKMVHLLTQSGLYPNAVKDIHAEIIAIIHKYIESLKESGQYDELVTQVKQFKLLSQIFDVFGETIDNYFVHDLFTTTDTDIDRQVRIADSRLSDEGISKSYGKVFFDPDDPNSYKIDVILFAASDECINQLQGYAKNKFHALHDNYRRKINALGSERIRIQYDRIISDGDKVSSHIFRLPEFIQVAQDKDGKDYPDHLFVSEETGTARFKLNAWETAVIAEEEQQPDFVCWIRNPSRGSWALTIPYEIDGEKKAAYPDFIIVRKDDITGYVIDILEPHGDQFADSLNKAKGMADYANHNPGIGRVQMIREVRDALGYKKYRRLDLSQSLVRDKVLKATNNDEFNHIFDENGFELA